QSRYYPPGDSVLPPGFELKRSKVKYFLLKFLLISPTNHRTLHYLRGTKHINKQKAEHLASGHWYIAHPFSKFRTCWEIIMAVTFFAAFMVYPYNFGFGEGMEMIHFDHRLGSRRLILDIIRALFGIFLLDIFANFITGIYVNNTKTFIMEPKIIAKRYLMGFFWIDLFSSIPINDILLYGIAQDISPEVVVLAQSVTLLKILRLKTFLRYLRQIIQMLQVEDAMIEEVLIAFVLLIIFIQWMGIAQYVVARALGYDHFKCYCFSGAVLRTYIIVVIMDLFIKYTRAQYDYLAMLDHLQSFMSHKKLPPALQANILMKFEYSYQKRYFREDRVLSTLPAILRMEIKDFICRPLIEGINFLICLPEDSKYDIIVQLKREIFLPKYVIIRAGARGDYMYIIRNGTAKVISRIGKEIRKLCDGDFFGEIALVAEDSKRTATIIAEDICEVYRLDRRDFEVNVLSNPTAFELVKNVVAERLRETMIEEEKHLMEE
ncbi:hypothetical protein L9F63_005365, partial [Diploptera punctata]